jgi:hypothetical protein
VRLPRELHLLAARNVLAAPHERLLGEVVASFLHREHCAVLPLLGLAQLLRGLVLEALLVRDRGGDLLLRLHELRAHVDDDLVQHLLRLFCRRDQVIDVRPEKTRDAVEYAHCFLDASLWNGDAKIPYPAGYNQ